MPSDYSRINLTDDADAIAQKIRKAKTDPEPLPSEEKGLEPRPEADNLVGIYAALKDTSKAEVLREFGGAQFSAFKAALVDLAVDRLGPIGGEMKRLVGDPAYIDSVLADGSDRARVIAAKTMIRGQGHRRLRPALSGFPFRCQASTRLVSAPSAVPPSCHTGWLGWTLRRHLPGDIR